MAVVVKRKGLLGFELCSYFVQGEAGLWQCGFRCAGFRVLGCGKGSLAVVLKRKDEFGFV